MPSAFRPKLAFLLAEALPEPEPARLAAWPSPLAEETPLAAPEIVPASPTSPLAEPLRVSTERDEATLPVTEIGRAHVNSSHQ